MDDERLDEAVRSGDLDELLRVIDQCCDDRDWSSLARLEGLCERAHETGRQLWPAASHAAYRLALEAPAPFAASVLREGVGGSRPARFPRSRHRRTRGPSWRRTRHRVRPQCSPRTSES